MTKKIIALLVMSLIVLTVSGCWDVQDIREIAFVTAIGIDAVADSPGYYKVTLEILRPGVLLRKTKETASIIETVTAKSLGSALDQIQGRVARTLAITHLRLILLGEEQARRDVMDIADFFQRSPHIQLRIRLMVVKDGEAEEVLRAKPLLEKYISAELIMMTMIRPTYSLVRTVPFFTFLGDLRSTGGRGFISRVTLAETNNFVIRDGGGVLADSKLIGWLSDEEAEEANLIVGKGNFIVDVERKDSLYTYYIEQKAVKITPSYVNGAPRLKVTVKTSGTLMQQKGEHLDLSDPKNVKLLENIFTRKITSQVKSAMYKSQKIFRTDYLGFGMSFKRRYSEIFDTLNWDEIYPDIPIDVEVHAKLPRFGLSE